jgi:hypothetical protein
MTSLEIAVSIAGFAAIAAVAFFILPRLWQARNKRLMRCPETGAVAFVDTTAAARGEETAGQVTVRWCELWPERENCARGCLARYPQTSPGYRVNVKALRPFDRL